MKNTHYVAPKCRFLPVDEGTLMAASNTVNVNMYQTEDYDGSFNAKSYHFKSVWDEEPTTDKFE